MPFAIMALRVLALAGAAGRGWLRLSWAWTAYSVLAILFGLLMNVWPATFWNYHVWTGSRDVYAAMKVLIAVEIAAKVFKDFPRAAALARVLVLGILGTAILPVAWSGLRWSDSFSAWHLPLASTTVWLFVVTALLVTWFHLPLHPWHRAILLGMTVHLLVFTVLLVILRARGWAVWHSLAGVQVYADLALAAWFAAVPWMPRAARAPALEGARA